MHTHTEKNTLNPNAYPLQSEAEERKHVRIVGCTKLFFWPWGGLKSFSGLLNKPYVSGRCQCCKKDGIVVPVKNVVNAGRFFLFGCPVIGRARPFNLDRTFGVTRPECLRSLSCHQECHLATPRAFKIFKTLGWAVLN